MNARNLIRHSLVVRWFKKLWTSETAPPSPVLLRVSEPGGGLPGSVTVAATWRPSGRVVERSHRTAEGLCVIPWLADEREVELEVRTSDGRSALSVRRDRPDGGRVHDLRLDEAPRRAGVR